MPISPSTPPIPLPQPRPHTTAANHRNIFHLTRRLCIASGFMLVAVVCALSISLMFIFHYFKTRVHDIESRSQPQTAERIPASAVATVAYREMKAEEIGDCDGACAICIEGFAEEEKCGVIENCGHFFHEDCIDRWLTIESRCPLCRCFVVFENRP